MTVQRQELQRLKWSCRRGMKELDEVLQTYLDKCYVAATPAERQAFDDILTVSDPEIYDLLTGRLVSDDVATLNVIHALKNWRSH